MNEEGLKRSAILLMSLGEENAATVMKHLSPREVQKLGQAMAALKSVNREEVDRVLEAFHDTAGNQSTLGMASEDYVRKVLTRALGDDRAASLIERILNNGDTSGIEGLKWMDSVTVADMIRNEHPQIIATILAHLDRDQASEVLAQFADPLRNDVVLRIATLDGIQPAALRELNEVMGKVLTGGSVAQKSTIGGVRVAAEILNHLGASIEGAVMESVRGVDAELAQKIQDEMFVFDNLLELDDRGMQSILREVQSEMLVIAIKGASTELREKVFRNMSQRAAETLREDLESKGPVKLSDVEAQQKEILKIARRLAEEGQITMGGKGEEAYV